MRASQFLVLVLVLVLVSLQPSASVRCFAHFNLTSGVCDDELGDVDEDDCCQNPSYGYQATDAECQSCGPPVWSPWSSWSLCNVLCGDGVRQRRRTCHGIGQSECENSEDKLHTEPCRGTCCQETGWSLWQVWSSCSVTCAGVGVRRRERVCSTRPECRSTCSGPAEGTDTCEAHSTCPVHGSWSSWSSWSNCSASCIDDQHGDIISPTRGRQRSCSDPAPSKDTTPAGSSCHGDAKQAQNCTELPNCPVDGGWGAWSQPGPCSAICGEGLQGSYRLCDSPPPKYGGRLCDGPNSRVSTCQSRCPVDGFWSGWSTWGGCSSSCIQHGRAPVRIRHRACSNPAPSPTPPGRGCQGDDRQEEDCTTLPHCPVNGGWGSWSPLSPCPVTCGVGLQTSIRHCDSPAPKHGGRPCVGEGLRTNICTTDVHCPVDGAWSEWSSWTPCKHPHERDIRCHTVGGTQTRERFCLHRAHGGRICPGGNLSQHRVCYDVDRCQVRGRWQAWGPWSSCQPACGANSKRHRSRACEPDYSDYRDNVDLQDQVVAFFGKPEVDCGAAPAGGGETTQAQPCLNVPACT